MENDKKNLIATKHAYDRAKQRLGWKKRVLNRMMIKAFKNGITHSQITGRLERYITNVWRKNKNVNNIRIYGEDIYFFAGTTLITMYRVPTEFTKYIKNFTNKNRGDEVNC